jgi:heptosyltransferase II
MKINLFFASCGGIGDLVCNMVVVDEMKSLNPNSKIIFGIQNKALKQIIELNPNIDEIVPYPYLGNGTLKSFKEEELKLKSKYDQVILFDIASKGKIKWIRKIKRWLQKKGWDTDKRHMLQRHADSAGIKLENKKTKFYYDQNDENIANEFLKKNGVSENDFVVMISHTVTGARFLRNWPIEKFEQLVSRITKNFCCKVIVTGTKDDSMINVDSVVYALGFPLRPTACLIKRSNLFIGMDSGLTHIAGCFKCEIVSIHSGYPIYETGCLSDSVTFVYKGPFKKPEIISVDEVYKAVSDRISETLEGELK